MKKKNLLQRTIIIVVVTLRQVSTLVIGPRRTPTLKDFTWSGIKATLQNNIHLGLDLKGGSHLVMRVKTNDYLKFITESDMSAAENAAKEAGIEVKQARAETNPGNYRVIVEIADPAKANEAKDAIQKKLDLNDTSMWTYAASGAQLSWTMTSAAQRVLADNATTQAMNIIDSRINALGITEPTLQTHGAQNSHQILLQMPGVQDPERIKKLLQGQSKLELVHVIGPPQPMPSTPTVRKRKQKPLSVAQCRTIVGCFLIRNESKERGVSKTARISKNPQNGLWLSRQRLSMAVS